MRKNGKQNNVRKGGRPGRQNAKSPRGKFRDGDHTYEADSKAASANDIKWWNHNPELTNSAGRLSFNNPLGGKIVLNGKTAFPLIIPGIAKLNFVPTLGVATSQADPINVAANNIYTWVRHMNSGARNYEAPDLMMWLTGMDSLYMYHAWMCRVYGVLNTYSITNRYIPLALAKAMSVDVTDLKGNMAGLLYYINNFAVRVGSLAVPDSFDYYKRHRFMVSNVYADAGNDKAQLYFYQPEAMLRYDVTTEQTGTSLQYEAFPPVNSNPMKLEDIIAFGESLLAPILMDEDAGIMSGDCLKAFGKENIIQLPMLQPDYAVMPDYNVEILGQIHNTTFAGNGIDYDANKIVQNNGIIISDIILTSSYPGTNVSTTWLLNSYDDEPSTDQVMEFTRNMMFSEGWADTTNNVMRSHVVTCGTEIISSIQMYNLNAQGELTQQGNLIGNINYISATNSPDKGQISYVTISSASTFDWFPLIYATTSSIQQEGAAGNNVTMMRIGGIVGDLRNYTVITPDVLQKLHETALLSAFSVEQVGRQVL